MSRIAISGGPRTGKTTLALALQMQHGGIVRHTDDLIGMGSWSDVSETVSHWFDEPGPYVIEGTRVSHALRKWRDRNPGQPPPVTQVHHLTEPRTGLTARQSAMAKGIATVHGEIADWLAPAQKP